MSRPNSLSDTLRTHDLAIMRWLGGLKFDYAGHGDGSVLRVMATPDRAFATTRDLLNNNGWFAGLTEEERQARLNQPDLAVIPLPLITVNRGDPVIDPSSAGVPKMTANWTLLGSARVYHQWPVMYTVSYTLSVWSAKKYTDAYILEWFMSQLGKLGAAPQEVFIQVDHPEPWGTILQYVRFDESVDLSRNEDNGDEQRYLRRDIRLTMRLIHFRAPQQEADTVERIDLTAAIAGLPGQVESPSDTGSGLVGAETTFDHNLLESLSADQAILPSTVSARYYGDGTPYIITFRDAADMVLASLPVAVPVGSIRVLGLSFEYTSTIPTTLQISENSGSESAPWTAVETIALQQTAIRKRVHRFFVTTQPWISLGVIASSAAVVALSNVRLLICDTSNGTPLTGDGLVLQAEVLKGYPHLVVVGVPATGLSARAYADFTDPSAYAANMAVPAGGGTHAVALVQPLKSLLRVLATSSTSATAYPYDGDFAGNDP